MTDAQPRMNHRTGAVGWGLALLLGLTALTYVPGLSGPWLFDDSTNIVGNASLRVEHLTPDSLWRAAWSLESGPLKRPVAYLTFALDYFFAGGYSAAAFKATNLAIHLLNALLVAVLARRMARAVWPQDDGLRRRMALLAAGVFALHPLALSPVLYVVQRMASLSTLFVLAALLCWLRARERWGFAAEAAPTADANPAGANEPTIDHAPLAIPAVEVRLGRAIGLFGGTRPIAQRSCAPTSTSTPAASSVSRAGIAPFGWLLAGGVFFVLGLFTKENAALLVLLYPLADRVLHPQAPYWRWLGRAGAGGRSTRAVLWLLAALAAGLLAWKVAPGYAVRPFTLLERQLTEARVLWVYLGLFALPRLDALGLYHDDIALSTGLLTPWTTLPALLGIAALVWLGFWLLRRAPLAGFAILWFFAAHLMESTLIPLEIAHEHRNYLPLVGLSTGTAWALTVLTVRLPARAGAVALTLVFGVLAVTTAARAWEWGESDRFYRYQVAHHPGSAHSRNDYASELGKHRQYADALEQLRGAQHIAPHEAGYYFNYYLTARTAGLPVPDDVRGELTALLQARPLSAFGLRALLTQGDCLRKICSFMAADMVEWLTGHIAAPVVRDDTSQLEYLLGLAYTQLGQIGPALNAFERSHALDPKYMHPLFEQTAIFMALGQWDNAEFDLRRLEAANEETWVRQDKALAELRAAIADGRGTPQ